MICGKTKVKVLIIWPNGEIYVRVPPDEESTLLIKNIALKKWKVAANSIFKHAELQPELCRSLWRVLNKELQEYVSSDCLLKGRSPAELIAFSSKLFVIELQVKCPIWTTCIRGACGLDFVDDYGSLASSMDDHEDAVKLNSLNSWPPQLLPVLETNVCLIWHIEFLVLFITVELLIRILFA